MPSRPSKRYTPRKPFDMLFQYSMSMITGLVAGAAVVIGTSGKSMTYEVGFLALVVAIGLAAIYVLNVYYSSRE